MKGKQPPPQSLVEKYNEERKRREVKRTKLKKKGYEVIIDGKSHSISEQFINGGQIKILAGITEIEERFSRAEYHEFSGIKGWFAYIKGNDSEPIGEHEEVDIIEHGNRFYTACNGKYIIS